MKLKMAKVRRLTKRISTPPPKQEHTSKPKVDVLDIDKEVKYDPNTGLVVELDEDRPRKNYPSCDSTTRVAKCYVCSAVRDKTIMLCVGQNWNEKGSLKYIWRCREVKSKEGKLKAKGCQAGSESWLKHYKHKSPLGKLWNYDLDKDRPIKRSQEETLAVGKQIVERRKEELNNEIAKRLERGCKKLKGNFFAEETLKALSKTLKKGAEKHGAKNVRVEIEPERRSVVVKREEKNADQGEQQLRSDSKGVVPRWKRKGRTAKVRVSRR